MNADNQTETQTQTTQPRRRLTRDEWVAEMDKKYPDRPNCCLCGNKTECPFGNNPAPIARKGVCCGECNNVVIFVRMGIIPLELTKKNLKMLYDLVVKTEEN